ncbi:MULTISPECIES: hypothetical protein [Streptosporangium]|uniref:Uncharacterized protein n=1 Tax=Streptosporangium brasiliense TaxID=47480 RepID=A0ABT9RI10_9ACTN|nr:hypothetical protein [Streptosporangium brasiliense]MDP9868922.1 hypothetical protein [Streptosporangium brasiliense]
MSETPKPGLLGNQTSLYDHALRLHRLYPDAALSNDGKPYPVSDAHRRRVRESQDDRRRQGAGAAMILDAFFTRPDAAPRDLTWAFHDVDVPIHFNEHITAAALRADLEGVQETGRWLVRNSSDECSTIIGLALLASDWDGQDIDLIKHIGLLSETFGPLTAHALKRRMGGGQALLWLARRTAGWGRVYIVEALCQVGGFAARPWLLREAIDGDILNGYYVGAVAKAADVHEAITAPDPDDDLIDHTGRLLSLMANNNGMGQTWNGYHAIRRVLDAHVTHLANQYLTILRRDDWSAAARADLDPTDERSAWFLETHPRRPAVDQRAQAGQAGRADGPFRAQGRSTAPLGHHRPARHPQGRRVPHPVHR